MASKKSPSPPSPPEPPPIPTEDLGFLTRREIAALEQHRSRKRPGLGPDLCALAFGLFLEGKSLWEVLAVKPGLELGAVVAARVEYKWDQLRAVANEQAHVELLQRSVYARVKLGTATADVACAIAEWLQHLVQAYRKKREANEPAEPPLGIDNLAKIGGLVDMLERLSGLKGVEPGAPVGGSAAAPKPGGEAGEHPMSKLVRLAGGEEPVGK